MAEQIAVTPLRRARQNDGPRRAPLGRESRTGGSNRRSVSGSVAGQGRSTSTSRPFRVPEVVVGVLLVAGCALAAVLLSQSGNATSTVVVAARPVARGSTIVADDLRGAQMSGTTEAMIGGDDAKLLLGRVALVDIAAGTPFSQAIAAAADPLAPDEALTSMSLDPGQLPPDLSPNDRVRMIVTSVPDATGVAVTTLLVDVATVWSVVAAPDGLHTIVTLRGPISLSSEVAAAAKVQLARIEGV